MYEIHIITISPLACVWVQEPPAPGGDPSGEAVG